MDIGDKIKRLRLSNQLTLEELANRSELTKGFYSQLRKRFNISKYRNIRKYFRSSRDKFERLFFRRRR